jgi:probable rRNA maturation factor
VTVAAAQRHLEVTDRFVPATPRRLVERVVGAVLAFVGRPAMPVSLLLTDEAEIAAIHDEFMGDPSATDVISFPLDDGVDVVVSVERAHREAAARGHLVDAELALYIVHGVLHACGYDDIEPGDRQAMRAAECAVLEGLGYRIAPVDPEST